MSLLLALTGGVGPPAYTLTAQGGSYSISGQQASLLRSKRLVASGGSYSFSGQSVVITYSPAAANYLLTAQGGSYTLSGGSASILRSRLLTASGGSYAINGASAGIFRSRLLSGSGGSYSLIGASSSILKSKRLVASGGAYSLNGSSAVITWATAGGAVWPAANQVLLGITYGPTGTEYTGTLTAGAGKKFRYDVETGNMVMILNDSLVKSL